MKLKKIIKKIKEKSDYKNINKLLSSRVDDLTKELMTEQKRNEELEAELCKSEQAQLIESLKTQNQKLIEGKHILRDEILKKDQLINKLLKKCKKA
ncbi:MAG: hypothetical protein IJ690_02005 [Clostridia bacterium]|nr:hypothetical protein [Clostridia bacterium]MBR1653715.1 hypothetical protein [Clostridia bacterium]